MPSRSDTSCANVVSWPWPWAWLPVRISTEPVGLTRTSADSHKPTPAPSWPTSRGRRHAASLDVGRKADAAQLAVAFGLALALAEALVVVKFERLLQRGVDIADIVEQGHRGLIRKRFDEVLAPQRRRLLTQFAGADFDEPFDHEGRFRASGAAIGIDRHRVGVNRVDLAVDVRDLILPGQQRRIEKVGTAEEKVDM